MGRRTLEITTVVGCSVGCSYCPQVTFVRAQREASDVRRLSFESFARCLATVPANVEINFSGYAEPWLHPDATAMAEHAAAEGHTVNVFSTLVGMTPEHVSRLARLSPVRFVVHLADEGADMLVRVDAAYLATLASVVRDVPGATFMGFGTLHPAIAAVLERARVPSDMVSRAGNVDGSIVRRPAVKLGALRCTQERLFRNVLLPNGDVTLCCADYGRAHVLGNLLTGSYAELFTGEAFRAVVARMAGAPGALLCRSCEWAAPATAN